MTSDGAYPEAMHDTFGATLDGFRCTATLDGRRCQLYAGHTDPHAHAWLEPITAHTHRRRGYPWHPHVERWTDDGERWWHDGTRLRWCCMFRR